MMVGREQIEFDKKSMEVSVERELLISCVWVLFSMWAKVRPHESYEKWPWIAGWCETQKHSEDS